MSAYRDFLTLLAFSEDEINATLPYWKNACRHLGLSERDVRFATEEWLPKYWDLSLVGVRICIGAYIREIIDITRLNKYKRDGKKFSTVMSHLTRPVSTPINWPGVTAYTFAAPTISFPPFSMRFLIKNHL